jgi:hypothetical protein
MKDKSRVKVEVVKTSSCGSVSGLEDEEPADYSELLRQVAIEQWAPLLDIPIKRSGRYIKPAIDDNGNPDYGAFGTMDFERMFPFNKDIYKIDRLGEQLKNTLIMFDIVKDKVAPEKRAQVIKHVYSGKDIDLIEDWFQWRMACWFSRARSIMAQIKLLRAGSYTRG